MRILLALNEAPCRFESGASNSNRLLLHELFKVGHSVHTYAIAPGVSSEHVTLATDATKRTALKSLIASYRPDLILCSSGGARCLLLEVAIESRRPVVFLARETLSVGFGPHSAYQFPTLKRLLPYCACVVGVSEYVAKYYRFHAGLPNAAHVPISPMENREWPCVGNTANPYVTMVNPCNIKGLPVFLHLAKYTPGMQFLAVRSWGTTAENELQLAQLPNVKVIDPVPDVVTILRMTRTLLVPSLWQEGRSRLAVEAQLCGVPVLSSNTGGLPEAMHDRMAVLPVNPIGRYERHSDTAGIPVADLPEHQPWQLWRSALQGAVGATAYTRRCALKRYIPFDVQSFEKLLRSWT